MANFIDRYKDYAREITDAPEIFHEYMGFALVSSMLKRQICFSSGDHGIYPNLYMVLIAPSSSFRKTTSLTIAVNLLRRVAPDLILPNEFSQEKLIELLATQPTGSFMFSEFKTLLGLLKRDYMAGTNAFLTDLYDCPDYYTRKTRSEEMVIKGAYVNIWGATTMEWLVKEIKDDDISSGFLARFLFVVASSKGEEIVIPPPADKIKQEHLMNELLQIGKFEGEMFLSKDAKERYEEIYRKIAARSETITHDYKCIYARLSIYILKFAMLLAAMKLQHVISEEDVVTADAYIQFAMHNLENIIENNLEYSKIHTQSKKVLGMIEAVKANGIGRSDLVWKSHLSAKELDEIISVLIESEKISTRIVKGIKKDRTFYYADKFLPKNHLTKNEGRV